uniref:ethanolamine kinase n=1 Tax=Eucampia antarctica TaxID=49252 RepID=A0A7S2S900_9STRA|mmetsp:Transcript_483/g.454  ORF Transcript_483/g.454 Transcript_483/m.454 type:complete len:178 (+) Transcript_483:2-535(+)
MAQAYSASSEGKMESLEQELHYLQKEVIPKYNSVIGFCHNDLLAANIMIEPSSQQIQLIDFEYGGVNYTPFDIANHFNEYAGGTTTEENGVPDYSRFPTLSQQCDFLQAYHNTSVVEEDMLKEVEAFVMVNHLYWGLWAINQAESEGCEEFDYSTYAQNRIQQYHICKQLYLPPNTN